MRVPSWLLGDGDVSPLIVAEWASADRLAEASVYHSYTEVELAGELVVYVGSQRGVFNGPVQAHADRFLVQGSVEVEWKTVLSGLKQ